MKYQTINAGDHFGRLETLERIKIGRRIAWICKCSCGNTRAVFSVVIFKTFTPGGIVIVKAFTVLPFHNTVSFVGSGGSDVPPESINKRLLNIVILLSRYTCCYRQLFNLSIISAIQYVVGKHK